MKIKEKLQLLKSKYMLALFAGFFAVGALPPFSILPCIFIAFSGLILLIDRAETKKQAIFIGFCFGFGFFSLGLLWVSNALMIDGMGFEALAPLPPIGFGLWGSLFTMPVCLIAFLAPKGVRRIFAFAGAWGVFEWVRSWLFTGFPWNPIGSIWTDWVVMIQSASIWGVYGLSIVTVLMATLPALVKEKSFKGFVPAYISMALFFVLFGFGVIRLNKAHKADDFIQGVLIRLVQANIPQGEKWSDDEAVMNLMKHVHLSRSEGADSVTHIVWPETATQFLLAEDKFARSMVTSALKPGGILLAGSLHLERFEDKTKRPEFFNSIVAFNDIGVLLGRYDKSHLVPFGEYAPLKDVIPFMKKITPDGMDFTQGKGIETKIIPRTLPVGMLVCYEVIFPGRVAEDQVRPYWLLNVTNDGWYGISAGPYQHLASTQMRAVEEGLPLIRSANTGISASIDAYGRVIDSLGLNKQGVLDVRLPYRTEKPTFYADYGNKVPLSLGVFLLIIAFLKFGNKRVKNEK